MSNLTKEQQFLIDKIGGKTDLEAMFFECAVLDEMGDGADVIKDLNLLCNTTRRFLIEIKDRDCKGGVENYAKFFNYSFLPILKKYNSISFSELREEMNTVDSDLSFMVLISDYKTSIRGNELYIEKKD